MAKLCSHDHNKPIAHISNPLSILIYHLPPSLLIYSHYRTRCVLVSQAVHVVFFLWIFYRHFVMALTFMLVNGGHWGVWVICLHFVVECDTLTFSTDIFLHVYIYYICTFCKFQSLLIFLSLNVALGGKCILDYGLHCGLVDCLVLFFVRFCHRLTECLHVMSAKTCKMKKITYLNVNHF